MIVENITKKEITFSKEEKEVFLKASKILDDIITLANKERLSMIEFKDTDEELETDLDTISWYLKKFAYTSLFLENY